VRELGKRRIPHEAPDEPPFPIRLPEAMGAVEELPGFRAGWFVVQDRTAMEAALLLDPQPGERVLDLCAAPGGKASHLAHLVGPEGSVVAVDRDPRRLSLLEQTRDRLSIGNLAIVIANASDPELELGELYDRVLADVPCSNTGVLAKRVEARHRVTPESIRSLAGLQLRILATACRHVRPGGAVVYSTCALQVEENREVVGRGLAADESLALEEDREILPRAGYADGGYAARLRKR
jgi:16S rRNA (cytosine967-C5)-methyltransferase